MESKTTIRFNNNAKDGDRIRFQLSYNGEPVQYTSGRNKIDKTFIEKISVNIQKIGETYFNGSIKTDSNLGTFSGLLATVNEVKTYNDYLIVVGRFNKYTHEGTEYNAKGVVILDKDTGVPVGFEGESVHNFFQVSNGVVHDLAIRKYQGKDYLCIVGEFSNFRYKGLNGVNKNDTNDNFIEIDLETFRCSVAWKQQWEGYTKVNDTIRSCDVYGNGDQNLVIGGMFTKIEGYNQSKVVNLNPNLTTNLQFRTNLGTIAGDVYKVLCHTQGGIFIGGSFTSVDGIQSKRLAKLNYNGTVAYNSGTIGGFGFIVKANDAVYDIIEDGFSIIFVGNFTTVNGSTLFKMAKVNIFSGVLQNDFTTNFYPDAKLRKIRKIDDKFNKSKKNDIIGRGLNSATSKNPTFVVGGKMSGGIGNLDYNAVTLDADGSLMNKIHFNDFVKAICVEGNTMIFGGDFSLYDNDTSVSEDEIVIGNNLTETRNNLLDNLNLYNNYSTSDYTTSSKNNNEIEIVWTIESIMDIITIGQKIEALPNVLINFETTGIEYKDLLVPIWLRSDNVVKSEEGNKDSWTNVDFIINGYVGDIGNFINSESIVKVNKKRLTDYQKNQYLEIGQLLDQKDFNPNYYFNYVEDDFNRPQGILSSRYHATDLLYFISIETKNYLGNNFETLNNFNIGFVLDGYRKEMVDEFKTNKDDGNISRKGFVKTIKPILNNGNYREVDDYFKLSLYTAEMTYLNITDLDTGNQTNYFAAVLPDDTEWLTAQFMLTPSMGRNLKISAVRPLSGNFGIMVTIDTFYVKFNEKKCSDKRYELLFKNSFGMTENIPINNVNRGYKSKQEDYKGFIRDIDGNYNTYEHTNKVNQKSLKETITCNTGNITERMNEQLIDLFNSKQIWLVERDNGDKLTPVKLKGNIDLQTSYKDNVVNYDIELEVDNNENKFIV